MRERRCSKCLDFTGEQSLIRLWDGNLYCRRCLNATLPELAEYAAAHDVLEETFLPGQASFKHALRSYLIGLSVCLILLGPVSWFFLRPLLGIYAVIVCLLLFGAGFLRSVISNFRRRRALGLPRTISLRDGSLSIETPSESHRIPIAEVSWFSGRASYDYWGEYMPGQAAIVLEVFVHEGFPRVRFSVGLSREMYLRWYATLLASDAELRRSKTPFREVVEAIVLVAAFAACGCFAGGCLGTLLHLAGGQACSREVCAKIWLVLVGPHLAIIYLCRDVFRARVLSAYAHAAPAFAAYGIVCSLMSGAGAASVILVTTAHGLVGCLAVWLFVGKWS